VPGLLTVRVVRAGRAVEARRDSKVPDLFWSRARAEWGSRGRTPGVALQLDTEHFLANLQWLSSACQSYGVSIDWAPEARALVLAHRGERTALASALTGAPPLSGPELQQRLSPTRFARPLRSFQEDDLARLLALAHGANFSVPGAGKTAVQLACYEAERHAGRVQRMLVAAPISAFEAWLEETRACFGQDTPIVSCYQGARIPPAAEIVLVNYQRLFFSYEAVAEWVRARPTLVCLDEAHRIKRGRAGEWGSTCLDLAYLAARRDVLTGTPAPQSPRDISVLLDYLWLGQGHRVLPRSVWAREPPAEVGHEVATAIKPLFVRTTKSDLRLPPVEFSVVPVTPDELQREIYAALRTRFAPRARLDRRGQAAFTRMGTIVMYLLEAATNPGLLSAGSSTGDALDFRHPPLPIEGDLSLAELLVSYGTYETPTKFLYVANLLAKNRQAKRKTLVWSNFVRNLEVLRGELAAFQPAVVHGGIPAAPSSVDGGAAREAEIARFRNDPDCWVLLANPAAIGEGVSLHNHCNDAVYLDRTFNAGQYLQSLDRIHRLGLPPETTTRITVLVSPGTIDEVVSERVAEKAERLGAMLDDPDIVTMALPDEEDVGAPFEASDVADVQALFAHLRGSDG
jgi:hypothetical protein